MDFRNVYEDAERAASYAQLEFPGTYYLAFRDLPAIIREHVRGKQAIDFGCGAGRSTRFLTGLGFETVGVDISEDMLRLARERDPEGDYRRLDTEGLRTLGAGRWHLVLSAFTFDNVPTMEAKVALFTAFRELLAEDGRVVNLVSSPELYTHDWASFTCTCFPGNFTAKRGDSVYTIMNDVEDRRPVHDALWPDDAYRETYARAGLEVKEVYKPRGTDEDPCAWVNEKEIAPWTIYVLGRSR